MESKLEKFLKEMRSMEYTDEKPPKNPAPNGITAAEIEALSTKAYSNSEPLNEAPDVSEAPPPPPPPEGVSYWQALVDPNTNLTYYWNSVTNDVTWTIPQGGVITLPMSADLVETRETEMELAMESYPYAATIPAKFLKPVVTAATASGVKGTDSPVPKTGTNSPAPKTGTNSPALKTGTKRLQEDSLPSPEIQPSHKKPRLKLEEQGQSPGPPAQAILPEEKIKLQVNGMVDILSKKLKHLQSSTTAASSMQLETLAIQLQTRQVDWNEGGVTTKYMLEKLKKMNEDIFMMESSLFPEDWSVSSDSEPTAGAVQSEPATLDNWPLLDVEPPRSPAVENIISPQSPLSGSEGAVRKSTGEVECNGSASVSYFDELNAENLTEEETADSPGPSSPQEILGPSPSLPLLYTHSEAKVEPETGMPEGEQDDQDGEGVATVESGRHTKYWSDNMRDEREERRMSREFGTCEEEEVETPRDERVGKEEDNRLAEEYDSVPVNRMQYERIVEDVSDKEEDEGEDQEERMPVEPQAPKEEEVEEEGSEEEGVWVEPGKERSEGELLDDSDSSGDEGSSRKETRGVDKEKFGPKEEKSVKKKLVDSYEKSEGELDQDSDDEKSEGELDDDKEEVWQEKTDDRVDKGSHSNRRQHYRTKTAHEQDSDYSDYQSSRKDRRDHRHYESDCSEDYYSTSRRSRHHRTERKGRDRSRERSRDRYRDDSDYSDDCYSSSRRHDRGRYGDNSERDYYRSSHYGGKSSRSGKSYSGSSNRHQHSHYSYDSDTERDHDRHRRQSSGKQRRRDREEKDKKRKHDYRGSSQNKDSDGEEKKPKASVLIGKVGKIGTVRLLGKEKKTEEGADSARPVDAAGSSAAPLPLGPPVRVAPPPLPSLAPAQAPTPQMSATYYQHPSTGEVPYYATYGASYQYPAYSAAQTYEHPPQQPEVQAQPQPQQEEEGWVWITNADGTPQWVRANAAAGESAEQGGGGTEAEQEVNPAQWGGADPVQWASAHAPPPPPLPPPPPPVDPEPVEPKTGEGQNSPPEPLEPKTEDGQEPKTEDGQEPKTEDGQEPKTEDGQNSPPEPLEPKTEDGQNGTETDKSGIKEDGGDRMCSSKESLDLGVEREVIPPSETDMAVTKAEGQEYSQEEVQLQGEEVTGVTGDSPTADQPSTAVAATADTDTGSPIAAPVVEEPLAATPLDQHRPSVVEDSFQKLEDIAECEMEIESNHGSPVATAMQDCIAVGNDQISAGGMEEVPSENRAVDAELGEQLVLTDDRLTSQVQDAATTEEAPCIAPAGYTGTETTLVEPPLVPAVEAGGVPASQQYSNPSVSSDVEASAVQAATIASSSATYYPSSTAAPPVDAAYSYAAAYGQPAYNYAYAQNYNYAYMQQAAAASYGAYGMQPGAPAYYQGMYPAPATGVYATYPQTYYAATSYGAVTPPAFQPPPSTAGAAVSPGTDKTKKSDFVQSGAKEKTMKTMMEQWTSFKDGEEKS